MMDLHKYEYCGKVKIVDNDGNEFIGEAEEVTDASDRSDLEKQEIGITIFTREKMIEFYISEIAYIEKL